MICTFDSVEINTLQHTFCIKEGSEGTYSLDDIQSIHVVYEQASFKGKSKPFTHTFLGGTSFFTAMEPKLYVGLKVATKSNQVLAIYVSKKPVLYNSDLFLEDVQEAKKIQSKLG